MIYTILETISLAGQIVQFLWHFFENQKHYTCCRSDSQDLATARSLWKTWNEQKPQAYICAQTTIKPLGAFQSNKHRCEFKRQKYFIESCLFVPPDSTNTRYGVRVFTGGILGTGPYSKIERSTTTKNAYLHAGTHYLIRIGCYNKKETESRIILSYRLPSKDNQQRQELWNTPPSQYIRARTNFIETWCDVKDMQGTFILLPRLLMNHQTFCGWNKKKWCCEKNNAKKYLSPHHRRACMFVSNKLDASMWNSGQSWTTNDKTEAWDSKKSYLKEPAKYPRYIPAKPSSWISRRSPSVTTI